MPLLLSARTIKSDDEIDEESSSDHEESSATLLQNVKKVDKHSEISSSFQFQDDDYSALGSNQGWNFRATIEKISEQDPRRARSAAGMDSRIASKRKELLQKKKKNAKKVKSDEKLSDDEPENVPEKSTDSKNSSTIDMDESTSDMDDSTGDTDKKSANKKDTIGSKSNSTSNVMDSTIENGSINSDESSDSSDTNSMDLDRLKEVANKRSNKKLMKKRKATTENSDSETGKTDDDVDEDERAEMERANEYFEDSEAPQAAQFSSLNLSRPLLRAVEALGYVSPTAIQSSAIPYALAGRDVCASAVTGSGKSAAFLLPILERLLYRPKFTRVTRVMVITPTRELGVQIHSMCLALGQFTDIECCLIVGGNKNLKAQEAELRAQPDIIVCTPGRMNDHILNTACVHLDTLEILVLDEADRLLELGFEEEVHELVKQCPRGRQTMLFSATMNTKVENLIKLALNRPVRVVATQPNTVATRLVQEFVKIRGNRESDREAVLLSLLSRTFKEKTIVFFDTKVMTHRSMLLLGLAGISAAELHGNLTMTQRLEALDRFKQGEVQVLVATDLAARGLDITGVKTVINYEMPRTRDTYIHRVGRTARAGCGGRSVTLLGEARRSIMKEVLKIQVDSAEIKSRAVPPAVIAHYREKIDGLQDHIEELLEEEKVERQIQKAEMEGNRATNIIQHHGEIHARPAREWILTNFQKDMIKKASKAEAEGKSNSNRDGNTLTTPSDAPPKKEKSTMGMTRKKRRRVEAKAREAKEAEQAKKEGKPGPLADWQVKGLVKSAKNEERARKKLAESKPLSETYGTRRKIEIGKSSGAFDVDFTDKRLETGKKANSKSAEKKAGAEGSKHTFTEFDPTMKGRKQGKQGRKHFKSKAKFKRKH